MSDLTNEQLKEELGRAYRCIQGMHTSMSKGTVFPEGYHQLTIAAAKRFVFEGTLDGTQHFVGKHHDVLRAALRLPNKEG